MEEEDLDYGDRHCRIALRRYERLQHRACKHISVFLKDLKKYVIVHPRVNSTLSTRPLTWLSETRPVPFPEMFSFGGMVYDPRTGQFSKVTAGGEWLTGMGKLARSSGVTAVVGGRPTQTLLQLK